EAQVAPVVLGLVPSKSSHRKSGANPAVPRETMVIAEERGIGQGEQNPTISISPVGLPAATRALKVPGPETSPRTASRPLSAVVSPPWVAAIVPSRLS